MSDEAQAMGILSDKIICECGNNSTLDEYKFVEPYCIAWYQVITNLYVGGDGKLVENENSSSDSVLWDTAKDTKFYCGECDKEVFIPVNMRPG